MIRSDRWNIGIPKERGNLSFSLPFPILGVITALLAGRMIGMLSPLTSGLVIVSLIMVIIIILRQDELAVTFVVATNLYLDWYLGLGYVSQIMAMALLVVFFLSRSPLRPWAEPRPLWLWVLFLLLTLFPATHGVSLFDSGNYYLNIIFGAFTFYWLGIVIARSTNGLRHFLRIFSCFGTLIALHSIIQSTTGIFLFATSRFDSYFSQVSNYSLDTSGVLRAGSFLVNPDSSGGFFAIMFFLPLCLFVESSSLWAKLFYLAEMFLILVALLFSFSTGAWLAIFAGILAFLIFTGYKHYRFLIPLFILLAAFALMLFFPTQVNLQIQHASKPSEVLLREGAWQTGIEVIRAFPLTGIGLGRYVYVDRAEPYRTILQYRPLAHPHNSFIEIGALAGLPVLLVFILLLVITFWLAIRNWNRSDAPTRSLLAGGMSTVIALSANSLFANGWTLIPLAAVGWLVVGTISSPLFGRDKSGPYGERERKTTGC